MTEAEFGQALTVLRRLEIKLRQRAVEDDLLKMVIRAIDRGELVPKPRLSPG